MGKSIGKVMGVAFALPTGGASLKWGNDYDKSISLQKKAQKQQMYTLAEQESILKEQLKDAMQKRREQIDQQREQISTGNYKTNATSTTGISSQIRGTLG